MNFLVISTFVVAVFGLWCCDPAQGATPVRSKPPSVSVPLGIRCGGTGYFYKILDEKEEIAYVACYDKPFKKTVFTIHKLQKWNTKDTGTYSRVFKAEGHLGTTDLDSYYKQHTKKFMEHFHKEYDFCAYEYFAGPNNYLARGHLVPDADFSTKEEKQATYNYINAAPQFQSVNQGDWLRVENYVRKRVEDFYTQQPELNAANTRKRGRDSDKVQVVTGVLGITQIQIRSRQGERVRVKNVDLYLGDDKKVPVPHLFWKAVKYPPNSGKRDLIFLRSNLYNGQLGNICTNICNEINFTEGNNHRNDANVEEGENTATDYTLCCDLNSLDNDKGFSEDVKPYRQEIRKNLKSADEIDKKLTSGKL